MGGDARRAEGVEARKDHDGLLEDVETHRTLQFLLQHVVLFLEIKNRFW